MITWTDLLIKLVNSIFSSKEKFLKEKRDKRDRIAEYFESISKTLSEAAKEFEKNDRPWDKYREISYLLENFVDVIGKSVDSEKSKMLYEELIAATGQDYMLLGESRERRIMDAITVRPPDERYTSNWKDNPVEKLKQTELEELITKETRKIKEISGLFKAVAVELRAT